VRPTPHSRPTGKERHSWFMDLERIPLRRVGKLHLDTQALLCRLKKLQDEEASRVFRITISSKSRASRMGPHVHSELCSFSVSTSPSKMLQWDLNSSSCLAGATEMRQNRNDCARSSVKTGSMASGAVATRPTPSILPATSKAPRPSPEPLSRSAGTAAGRSAADCLRCRQLWEPGDVARAQLQSCTVDLKNRAWIGFA